jgi:hypothetical protein
MKRYMPLLLVIFIVFALSACEKEDQVVFTAVVLENTNSLLVEPPVGSNEHGSSDKIVVLAEDAAIYDVEGEKINLSDISAGQTLEITYNGMIAESYPAQIWASNIQVME